jgi:hypothetical protein
VGAQEGSTGTLPSKDSNLEKKRGFRRSNLQGEDTDGETVREIGEAIDAREPITTTIINYRKDGEQFENLLYVRPLFQDDELKYFIGFQIDLSTLDVGQDRS